jgi:hypothetical protein
MIRGVHCYVRGGHQLLEYSSTRVVPTVRYHHATVHHKQTSTRVRTVLVRVQVQYPAGYIYFSSCFSSSSEPRRRLARKIFAVVACRWLSLNHVVDDVVLYQSHFLNCSICTLLVQILYCTYLVVVHLESE